MEVAERGEMGEERREERREERGEMRIEVEEAKRWTKVKGIVLSILC